VSYFDDTLDAVIAIVLRIVLGLLLLALGVLLLVACGAGRHGLELWSEPPRKNTKPERRTPCVEAGKYLDPVTLKCREMKAPDVTP
jgi:hypothetical protein